MDELLVDFLTETAENLSVVDNEIVRWERNPNDRAVLDNIFRLVHTVKGTCGFLNLPRLEALAHAGETVLGRVRDGKLAVSAAVVSEVLAALDGIKAILRALEATGREPEGDDTALIGRLERVAAGEVANGSAARAAGRGRNRRESVRSRASEHPGLGGSARAVDDHGFRARADAEPASPDFTARGRGGRLRRAAPAAVPVRLRAAGRRHADADAAD